MNNINNYNELNENILRSLLASDLISNDEYNRTWSLFELEGTPVSTILTTLGFVSDQDVAETLSALLNSIIISPSDFPKPAVLLDTLPITFLKQSKILPLDEDEKTITLAMVNPLDAFVINAVETKCEKRVIVKIALQKELEAHFSDLVQGMNSAEPSSISHLEFESDIKRLRDIASEAPVIKTVNQMISDAIDMQASDIHLEPFDNQLHLRFRIDGLLKKMPSPASSNRLAIISRIKILADLDIAERRLPQDGRIKIVISGREIDIRVSTLPTLHGEGVVLRLLDHSKSLQTFEDLGFSQSELTTLLSLLNRPNGIILVTGPTGSGKTTSLYASLLRLNKPDVKIVTVEDPIEYQIKGINQIQTHSDIGLGFAAVLRSILRHDPDVIMIGEIRDVETARIAVQASLTGHLVLSTLHTNSAISAVTRLMDMGIDRYLIASTLEAVIAQRLVRKLCPGCRMEEDSGKEAGIFYKAVGCDTCNGTGYSGRSAIAEILTISEEIESEIIKGSSAAEIYKTAASQGFRTLFESGVEKVTSGITSLEEVHRVTQQQGQVN